MFITHTFSLTLTFISAFVELKNSFVLKIILLKLPRKTMKLTLNINRLPEFGGDYLQIMLAIKPSSHVPMETVST